MPNDLWYFRKSNLDKAGILVFLNSLPNHLKIMFEDSFGGLRWYDRDNDNVLQAYRGPHNNGGSGNSEYLGPSNGLQEVRYWWGPSKKLLYWLVPFGFVSFGIFRAIANTNWHSLYFDSMTGECLGHDKNEAAKNLNDKGHQLFQEGKYAEAEKYHNNAYQACSSGYEHKQTFKNDRDKAKAEADAVDLNLEGEILFNQGKYTEALRKYEEAYDKSQTSEERNKYRTNAVKAQADIDVIKLNSEGDHLFSQGKYAEARIKYQAASLVKKENK